MKRAATIVAVVLVQVLALVGCGLPRDTGSTLADVRGGVLRVGVAEDPPWTTVPDDGAPAGAEVQLVQRLAERLGTRVEWHPGSESDLMSALKDRVLDLVVGGLDAPPFLDVVRVTLAERTGGLRLRREQRRR
jgi:polar amino acid transport system substrate-binding protein